MSTPRSHRTRRRIDLLLVFAALVVIGGMAQAKRSDKNQLIHISANHFAGSQGSGKITFSGDVEMHQGTFHADAAKATGYTAPNDTSQWQRIVLTGHPAHFSQVQDNGTLVHGQADRLTYQVSQNTVILTGDATVVQQGKGQFHGNKLIYDTDTGRMVGSSTAGGRVHITLQPSSKPAPASSVPAPATSTLSPATATTSAALPALSMSTPPANPMPASATSLAPSPPHTASSAPPAVPASVLLPASASSTGH